MSTTDHMFGIGAAVVVVSAILGITPAYGLAICALALAGHFLPDWENHA